MMQNNINNINIIGLTGGTGTGKSTICNILKKYNAVIIDADKIGHEIIKKDKPAYKELVEYFNNKNYNILENNNNNLEINRKLLGSLVFGDEKENKENLEFLTKTTHKYIIKQISEDLDYYKNNCNYNYIILDAPLLIEANLHEKVDTVWIVTSDLKTRLERLKKRDNLKEEILLKRINNQTPFDLNKKYADIIIKNNGETSIEELEKKIKLNLNIK